MRDTRPASDDRSHRRQRSRRLHPSARALRLPPHRSPRQCRLQARPLAGLGVDAAGTQHRRHDPAIRTRRMILRHRLAIVLGLNQTMTWGMTFYLPAVIAEPAAHSIGASHVAILGAFTWALLVTSLAAPRVGKWIDRHGGRGSLAISIAITAAGQLTLATATNLYLWYIGWSVIGAGMALG